MMMWKAECRRECHRCGRGHASPAVGVHTRHGRPTCHTLEVAAFNGYLSILEWLHCGPTGLVLGTSVFREAVRGGKLEVLKWLHERQCPATSAAIEAAAGSGFLEVVQCLYTSTKEWLHEDLHQSCTTWSMDNAARQGYLHVVKSLHFHRTEGCTAEAMSAAAENGHLDVVRWLHWNRTEGCDSTALSRAITEDTSTLRRFFTKSEESRVHSGAIVWDELKQDINLQVSRSDWHFDDWMRGKGMQVVNQNENNMIWNWSPHP
ncbi:Ankyrin repeat-containing domain [Phytophthora cactorum]|nr:Ankyrin repeat-containing domain [Phytophthora cactorum]